MQRRANYAYIDDIAGEERTVVDQFRGRTSVEEVTVSTSIRPLQYLMHLVTTHNATISNPSASGVVQFRIPQYNMAGFRKEMAMFEQTGKYFTKAA